MIPCEELLRFGRMSLPTKHEYSYGRNRSSLPEFAKIALGFAAVIGLGAGAVYGSYAGVQAVRAMMWEDDALQVKAFVDGASSVGARELDILAKREKSSKEALESLIGREQEMEFLAGQAVPSLVASRAKLMGDARSRIQGAMKMEASLADLLATKSKGTLSSSEFIEKASSVLEAGLGSLKANGRFAGDAGFASASLANWEALVGKSSREAAEKLARMDDALPQLASSFDAQAMVRGVSALSHASKAEAEALGQASAREQVEAYRSQIRQAADEAFRREGETMGQSDWDEIDRENELDPQWIEAKSGLMSAAAQTAAGAAALSGAEWADEGAHALALAGSIAHDPSTLADLSVWERAYLMQWMTMSNTGNAKIHQAPGMAAFAHQGYSLSGLPKAALDARSAMSMASGQEIKPPQPPFSNSQWTASIGGQMAIAGGNHAKAAAIAKVAEAASRARQKAASAEGKVHPNYATPQGVEYRIAQDKKTSWNMGAAMVAAKAAANASNVAASKAAGLAAGKAADAAAGKAAGSAAGRAAQSAASKAAAVAATKAAQSAANKAAASASSKAAQSASSRAASTASSRSAMSSSSRR